MIVNSRVYASTFWENLFRYIEAGSISRVSPSMGPVAGGNLCVIHGSNMVSKSIINQFDLIGVSVAGVVQPMSRVKSVNDSMIEIVLSSSNIATIGHVVVYSASQVNVTSHVTYQYVSPGVISSVVPDHGDYDAVTRVTITSDGELSTCVGDDLISVVIVGVTSRVVSCSPCHIVVDAQPTAMVDMGDVVITSHVYGVSSKHEAFTYIEPSPPERSVWGAVVIVAIAVVVASGAVSAAVMVGMRRSKRSRHLLLEEVDHQDYETQHDYQTTIQGQALITQ